MEMILQTQEMVQKEFGCKYFCVQLAARSSAAIGATIAAIAAVFPCTGARQRTNPVPRPGVGSNQPPKTVVASTQPYHVIVIQLVHPDVIKT